MLEDIKLLLGITDNKEDKLLNLIIKNTTQKILTYTNRTEITADMECLVEELCVVRYRKIGLEHSSGQSFSGASITIMDSDIPKIYQEQLNKYKKIRLI